MSDDENSGEPTTTPTQPSGTANLLQNYSAFVSIEEEYDRSVASGLLRKSLGEHGVEKTLDDVKAWADVSRAIVTKPVNVGQELREAKAKTDVYVNGLLSSVAGPGSYTPPTDTIPIDSKSNQSRPEQYVDEPLDELDEDEAEDQLEEDEYDSLQEIFNTDDVEDAEEQAYDHVLKMIENVD
ncbi:MULTISPECIES: hypothetical protein [Pseudomonas]|uniref:hypothetical protein n=1 Tax=Pseudomonas TaxID=286 RepID=UPI001AE98B39|nr:MULTISPECIES: hypothetical protein [unclassified Pseudomonas]MBP1126470.1 hypothetical protein [Pseudomonas sp. PvP025]MDQ0400330.1 hypothetical protein [Pseudomonas sp. PvP006]